MEDIVTEFNNWIIIGAPAKKNRLEAERARLEQALVWHQHTRGALGWFLRRHYAGKLAWVNLQIDLVPKSVRFAQRTLS